MEEFLESQGDVVDSLETTNFNYYLIRGKDSDLMYELKMGRKITTLDVRTITDKEIAVRYAPGHKAAQNNPWD